MSCIRHGSFSLDSHDGGRGTSHRFSNRYFKNADIRLYLQYALFCSRGHVGHFLPRTYTGKLGDLITRDFRSRRGFRDTSWGPLSRRESGMAPNRDNKPVVKPLSGNDETKQIHRIAAYAFLLNLVLAIMKALLAIFSGSNPQSLLNHYLKTQTISYLT